MKLYSPEDKEILARAIKSISFAKTAFGIEAEWEDRISRYKESTEIRSKEFENHLNDIILK
jgi:hypothetical protein